LSTEFENTLIETFESLSTSKFKVNLKSHHIFVCGGIVDITAGSPLSFRHHLMEYSASKFPDIHESIVQAETFKDYFKENAYPDLLIFEEEIANLASLVLIFLESPGSLVELGMFCTKPDFFKKLLIIAPQEEVSGEDSFIYLGPLENIRKKEPTAVEIYPWPKININYEKNYLNDLCLAIKSKLSCLPKKVEFNFENSGHIALLIAEIIRISYPIILHEIEYVLMALKIELKLSEITRHIYLLNKLELIKSLFYSSSRYYYSTQPEHSIFSFGKLSTGNSFDENMIRMKIQQSYIISSDDKARKRQSAMSQIRALLNEVKNDC